MLLEEDRAVDVTDGKSIYYSQVVFETYFIFSRGDRRFEKPGRKDVGKACLLFWSIFI